MNALVPQMAERLRKWRPARTFALGLIFVLALATLDQLTPGMAFTFWYVLGVALVAWGAGRWPAIGVAVVATGGLLLVEQHASDNHRSLGGVLIWNSLSRLALLVFVGWLVAEVARLTRLLGRLVAERTAQWQAEAQQHEATAARLSEMVQRFEQIADNIQEVFWLFDPKAHRFLYVSPGFERVWGRKCEELYTTPECWESTLHPEDRARLAERPRAEQATGPYEAEYRVLRPDGSVRWIRDRAFPVRNPQGEVQRIAGLAQDITAWKTAWQTLSTQAYLLENLQEAVVMTDEAGVIQQINPATEALLGYTRTELLGKPVQGFFSASPQEAQELLQAVLQQTQLRGHATGEYLMRRKDSTSIWVSIQSTRLRLNEGQFLVLVGQDITERKRVEEALRRSQQALGEAMDQARLANWEYDVASGRFTFDDRFYRLYGTSAEREGGYQMLPETYEREFLLPEDAHLVTQHIAAALATTEANYTYQVEHRIRRRDGEIRHLVVRVAVIKDAAGRTIKTRGVNQDITELKQAEQERSEALELNRMLIAASPVGIAAYKASGQCILANEALANISGGRVEQLLAQNFRSLASWQNSGLLAAADGTLSAGHPQRGEFKGTSSFGKVSWMSFVLTPFTNKGEPHLLLMANDITERKQAEQRLAEALDLNEKMLAASLVGIAAYRASGECVFVNQALGRMAGGPPERLREGDFRQLESWRRSGLLRAAEEALQTGEVRSGEFCLLTRFGKTVWLDAHAIPFVSAGQQLLLMMGYDISERKRSEHQVLEISDREQARIGQDLHDGLCQQLVSLAFDANALLGQLAADRSSEATIAQRIADLLDQTITEARNVSRGLFPVRLETDGLASALEELAKSTSQRHRVQCAFTGDAPNELSDQAQAVHLYRIVQEAVNNAVKHARPTSICIELLTDAKQFELKITDDGLGLPAASAVKPQGLGLHIMEYRARSLGGTLKVAPGSAGGTTVCCCIPRRQNSKITP